MVFPRHKRPPVPPVAAQRAARLPWRIWVWLSVGVVVVVAVLAVSREIVVRRWGQAERELALAQECLEVETQLSDSACLEFEAVVAEIRDMLEAAGHPPDASAYAVLRKARRFFERVVDQTDTATLKVARAYHVLGETNRLLQAFDRAEWAYRHEWDCLANLPNWEVGRTSRQLQAESAIALGHLLAITGKLDEALEWTAQALTSLKALRREDEKDLSLAWVQALAHRNLGMIEVALGRDGIRALEASGAVIAGLRPPELPAQLAAADFLVDSQNDLARQHARQRRWEEAVEHGERCVAQLRALMARFSREAERQTLVFRHLKYQQALARAEANLKLAREARQNSVDGWNWTPLATHLHHVVPPEVYRRGVATAEFETQDAVALNWIDEGWAQEAVLEMASHLHTQLALVVLVEHEGLEREARAALARAGVPAERVTFCHVATDSVWIRDFGPFTLRTGVDTFAWGGMPTMNDRRLVDRFENDRVPLQLGRIFDVPVLRLPLFLEGGHWLTNGAGLVLVSQDVLVKNAELGLSEAHVTATLRRLLGAEQLIYVQPLSGEPTGHVDMFATFTSVDTVVLGDDKVRGSENARRLNANAQRLAGIPTRAGPLQVVRVPMPPPGPHGLQGTYTNVVYANRLLLIPTWPHAPRDLEQAVFATYGKLLPDWKLVGIDATRLAHSNGALHCAALNLTRLPAKLPTVVVPAADLVPADSAR